MVQFSFLKKEDFAALSAAIFSILAANMKEIAPTGNSSAEDYNAWFSAVKEGLKQDARKIILIHSNSDLIGFFQYYTNGNRLMMEEIQICRRWQGKGVFQSLYGFLIESLPPQISVVEAYANKRNEKSKGILRHLGLTAVGENKKGDCYHFRGEFESLLKWYYCTKK